MTELDEVIAHSVCAERARRHWRQVDLAARMGWSTSRISDLETGDVKIKVGDLLPLCEALEVGLPVLLAGADTQDLATLGVSPR